MRLVPFILLTGLTACSDFPVLEGTIDDAARAAPYPALAPLAPVLAQAEAGSAAITPAVLANINSRIAVLNAGASRLRGPVVDATTRARMRRGVAVPR